MSSVNIAVIMTVYNRKDATLRSLDNLNNQDMPESIFVDVWLTDDGCTDGTREAVVSKYPDTHIVDGNGHLFWNRGMWRAWESASKFKDYDFYLWLNDDTYLYEFAIKELIRESELHSNRNIIIGSTKYQNKDEVSYGGYVRGKIVTPNGSSQPVDFFNGNIVLVPSFVFKNIGNLDPYFNHGHGDTDYGLRARENNIDNYVVGSFLGECNRHERDKKCWDPDVPLFERLKNLHQPLGYPAHEQFYFEMRHKNIFVAVFHFLTLYIHVLFPGIWRKMHELRKMKRS